MRFITTHKRGEFAPADMLSVALFICLIHFVIPCLFPVYARSSFRVKDQRLDEISGIVASRVNKDAFYVHNDSGGKSEVYVMNSRGKVVSTIVLQGVKNRDWEDIAVGPGPEEGSSYVYIGEIGDNNARHEAVYLYRFKEPNLSKLTRKAAKLIQVTQIDTIRIIYEDGARDSETLFIDSVTGNAYIVSKRESQVGVYQAKAVLDTREINLASRMLSLNFPMAVGGDITPKGDKIIIKTYDKVFYWQIEPNQSIVQALANPPVELPYTTEPQGEAICWSADGRSYLTISERHKNKPLYLYKYNFNRKQGR